jgi:heme-degrading monooxygenase HmoA
VRPARLFLYFYLRQATNCLPLSYLKKMFADTPTPPYYAVIFSSYRTEIDEGYGEMAEEMVRLARLQPGYLGHESARDGLGITISYWENLDAIKHWKANTEHLLAQKYGREKWYSAYKTRIALVQRDYEFGTDPAFR